MLLTRARNTSPVNLAQRSESTTSASENPAPDRGHLPRMTAAGSFAVAVEREGTARTLPDSRSTWFRTMRRNRPPPPAARRSGPPRSSRRRAAMAEARCGGPRAVRGSAAPAIPAGLARASAEVPPNGASWHSRKTCRARPGCAGGPPRPARRSGGGGNGPASPSQRGMAGAPRLSASLPCANCAAAAPAHGPILPRRRI